MKQPLYLLAIFIGVFVASFFHGMTAQLVWFGVTFFLVFTNWLFYNDDAAKIARRQRKQTRDFNKGRKPK